MTLQLVATNRRGVDAHTATAGLQGVNIVGGHGNNAIAAGADAGTIAGGGFAATPQRIDAGSFNTISGGYDDRITTTGVGANTIAGGAHHRIEDTATHGTIAGGSYGDIDGASDYSTVSGGTVNAVHNADNAVIAGGALNTVESGMNNAVVSGGVQNTVAGLQSTIGGGLTNVSATNGDAIAGGTRNAVKGGAAVVAGGADNTIGPARVFNNATMVASDQTVTVADGDFSGGDVGATVYLYGCGVNFAPHKTTIASVTSATEIEVTTAPPVSRASQSAVLIGTGAAVAGGAIGGGLKNKVLGVYDAIAGGRENVAGPGAYAAVGGGFQNAVAGIQATVAGGTLNAASATGSAVGGGLSNTASGGSSVVAGGSTNTASGAQASVGGGFTNQATADYSTVPGGRNNLASIDYSIATGFRAVSNLYGAHAHAAGRFAADGDAQTRVAVLRRQVVSSALPNTMLLDGSVQRLLIPDDTTWAFSVLVVARRTDADNESAAYKLEGCIDRNAGTVALVGTVTKTVLAEDTAAWDAEAIANNTDKSLDVRFTGEAAKTINVVARVELVEVTG